VGGWDEVCRKEALNVTEGKGEKSETSGKILESGEGGVSSKGGGEILEVESRGEKRCLKGGGTKAFRNGGGRGKRAANGHGRKLTKVI